MVGHFSRALSIVSLSGILLPRRQPPSAVIANVAPQSLARSAMLSALKPAKMTVCGAPSRAQASIAIGELGNHAQVDRHPIAFFDTQAFECRGGAVHFAVQVAIGEDPTIAWLALEDDGGLVAAPGLQVPIDAVVAGVDLGADEPSGRTAGPTRASSRTASTSSGPLAGAASPRTPRSPPRPRAYSVGLARWPAR